MRFDQFPEQRKSRKAHRQSKQQYLDALNTSISKKMRIIGNKISTSTQTTVTKTVVEHLIWDALEPF